MKTLYLECAMGAAGDMLTAALLELTGDRQAFIDKMNALGLPGVSVAAEPAVKCGITGTMSRSPWTGWKRKPVMCMSMSMNITMIMTTTTITSMSIITNTGMNMNMSIIMITIIATGTTTMPPWRILRC